MLSQIVIAMKKLSLYIFLVLMFCNVGFAEKISFLDIKIGDKITDHFTSNQINKYYMDDEENTTNSKGERVYGREVIYSFLAIIDDREIFKEDYSNSGIQIYYENDNLQNISISNYLKDVICVSQETKRPFFKSVYQ